MDKDVFDYIEEDEEAPDRTDLVWNIATIVVLVITLCIGVLFLTVLMNPNAGLNPFPPPALPVAMKLDTLTPTPKQVLPPTWTVTPTDTLIPTETNTPEPSATPLPVSDTPVPEAGDAAGAEEAVEAEPEEDPLESDMPFVLHDGNPQYIPNLYHAELDCNWMGVGGQVLSLNGAPVTGVVVRLGGQLAGQNVDLVTVSGIATKYGPAGYEFDLTELVEGPTASSHSMWVQLLDQAGLPMSTQIYFDTYEECDKSTIIIYFKQVK
jgi:hypothetical protein